MRTSIQVDPWSYVLGALLVLLLPLNWLLSALAAAAFHELCHGLCIRLLGGRVLHIRIGPGGTVMETALSGKGKELICALAGPAGSLLLVCLCRVLPRLAVCGLIQGLFNLLPVYPLDGGRALRCSLEMLFPKKGRVISTLVETWLLAGLAGLAIWCAFAFSLGLLPPMAAALLILRAILRKIPCKERQIRVQ